MYFFNCVTLLAAATALFLGASLTASEDLTSITCKQTADVIFVVDTSSSIWPPYFNENTKDFIKAIISNFNVGLGPFESRIGLILFSTGVYKEFYLKDYKNKAAIENHITKMRYRGGGTATDKALNFVSEHMLTAENGMRSNVSKLVIIITDGESRYPKRTRVAVDLLKTKGVDVFAIGVGPNAGSEELKYMASDPDEDYVFHVKNFNAIGKIEKKFVNQTCKVLKAVAPTTTTTTTQSTTTTSTTTTTTTTTTPTTTTTTPTTTSTTTPTTTYTTTTPTTTTTTTTPTTTTSTTTPTTTSTTSTTSTTTTPTTTSSTTTPTTTTTTAVPTTTTKTTPSTTTTTTLPTTTITTKAPKTKPPKHITTTDNDRPLNDQPSPLQACQNKPADIYFLLDASSSVWINHFHNRVLPFVRKLVSSFEISPMQTRVGLVTFSDDHEHVFTLAQHHNLKSLLKSLQPENVAYLTGGTNTGDAINFITTRALASGAARKGVAKIIITVTDGLSQRPEKTAEAAKIARQQGIVMFSVGVGKYVDDAELANIASEPDEDYVFTVESFNELSSITELLAGKTCSAVSKSPENEDYFGKKKIDCSAKPLNVMFIYEYMNSVQNSKRVLDHVISDFATQATIYAPEAKIGVMTQPCVGGEISMLGVNDFQLALVERSSMYYVTLADIVQKVRLDVFKTGGDHITEKKVAVLVLDSHVKDVEALRKEVRRLKFQNVQVMILAIGKMDERLLESIVTYPMKKNVMRVDTYADLEITELELLHRMCSNSPGIFGGEPMNDAFHLQNGAVMIYPQSN